MLALPCPCTLDHKALLCVGMAECQQHSEGGEVAGAVAVTMAIIENSVATLSPPKS